MNKFGKIDWDFWLKDIIVPILIILLFVFVAIAIIMTLEPTEIGIKYDCENNIGIVVEKIPLYERKLSAYKLSEEEVLEFCR